MKIQTIIGVSLAGSVLFIGCGKKSNDAAAPTPEAMVQPQEYTKVPATGPKEADEEGESSQEMAEVILESEINSHAAMLTFMVQEYAAQRGQAPAKLEDLVFAGMLPAVPKLPPGWTFNVDAQNKQVTAVKQ